MMRFLKAWMLFLIIVGFSEKVWAVDLCANHALEKNIHPYLAQVIIAEEPTVTGDDILLGEIACIVGEEPLVQALAKVKVGASPLIGQKRDINIPTLRLRIRQAGIRDETVDIVSKGAVFTVKKAFQILPKESISALIKQDLNEELSSYIQADISLNGIDDILVPVGEISLKITHMPAVWSSILNIPIEIRVNGGLYKTMLVRADMVYWQTVWVATKRIEKGEKFGLHNTEQKMIQGSSTVVPAFMENPELYRTNRVIQPDTIIEQRFVEKIPDALKGEPVMILAIVGDIEVKTAGTMLTDGWIGEMTSVRNNLTGAIVSGRLTDPGMVEVAVP
jgi:flagella basal body P-ring formation protein FlgA